MSYTIAEENRAATSLLIIKALVLKFILLLLFFHFADIAEENDSALVLLSKYIFLPYYAFTFASFLVIRRRGLEKKSLTIFLKGELLFSSILSYLIFSRYVIAFLTVPLLISTRSFEERENHSVALFTWIGYVCADILNIHLEHVSPLFREIHYGLVGDMWMYPSAVVKYQIIPTTFVIIITVIITDSINNTGRELIKKLVDNASKMAVIKTELELASEIQQDILPPAHFRSEDGRVAVDAVEKSAREVCGDFYDYFMIDDTHLAFMVADVSDKGVSAAMFMMKARTILNLALRTEKNLAKVLETSNYLVIEHNSRNYFLTAWVGVLDLSTNTMEFVNCGHPMPVLLSKDKKARFIENEPELILGCFENAVYHPNKIKLEKGDCIVLYTDGVTDILNGKNEAFSEKRLLSAVASGITDPDKIVGECEKFAGSVPRFDDITVLSLHV